MRPCIQAVSTNKPATGRHGLPSVGPPPGTTHGRTVREWETVNVGPVCGQEHRFGQDKSENLDRTWGSMRQRTDGGGRGIVSGMLPTSLRHRPACFYRGPRLRVLG